jgi:hypothetical protein
MIIIGIIGFLLATRVWNAKPKRKAKKIESKEEQKEL